MEPKENYIEIGRSLENSIESQLFGKPCFKIKGKPFIAFFEESMIFKLTGEDHQEALSLDGCQLFDPSKKNRPMKEWVQVPFSYAEQWAKFAKSALKYVSSLSN